MIVTLASTLASLKAAIDWSSRRKKRLARNLLEISSLLDDVHQSFLNGKIPREQSTAIVMTINFSRDIVDGIVPFPHLVPVFAERLPNIGRMMRGADVLIDGKFREDTHSFELAARDIDYSVTKDPCVFNELFNEIERARGELVAAAKALDEPASGTARKLRAPKKGSKKSSKSLNDE